MIKVTLDLLREALSYLGGGFLLTAGIIVLVTVILDLRGMILNIPNHSVNYTNDPFMIWAYWFILFGVVLLTITHFIS